MEERNETMETTEKKRPALLRIEGLSATDAYEKTLENVTLEIPEKGVHAVLGPKGAGKTLLLDLLSGSEWAESGRILLGDTELNPDATALKKRIGYVQQSCPFEGSMTVYETLDFVGEVRGVASEKRYRQIKEALDLTGLDGCRSRLVKRLTAEEQKRLGLAAALLGNPEILLLDEPFPTVGAEARRELCDLIAMLGRIKTVVLAVSEFDVARSLCEDVMILSDGRLMANGTFERLETQLKEGGETESLEQIYRMLVQATELPKLRSESEFKENDGEVAE